MGIKQQQGNTFLGFVIGVVVGLAGALLVAVYVTKVPINFINRSQARSAEQDEAEAQKNRDWNPNAPLQGKNPVKTEPPIIPTSAAPAEPSPPPATEASTAAAPPAAATPAATPAPAPVATPSASSPAPVKNTSAKPEEKKPTASADPLGDLAKAKANTNNEPFLYFVQIGAYRSMEDAQNQRAKLSLSGIDTKITERDQGGNTVYRVRVGPFEKKDDAERSKEKLEKSGIDTSLVRVPRA
jgi:cell division protein FtsN